MEKVLSVKINHAVICNSITAKVIFIQYFLVIVLIKVL